MKFKILLLAGCCLVMGCSPLALDFLGRSFGTLSLDPGQVTRELADPLMPQGYQAFARAAEGLQAALAELAKQPDPSRLAAARAAWKATAQAWVATEAYQFGPVSDLRLQAKIDYWPRQSADIETLLSGSEPIQISTLGATRRGLPVLEYLLFGSGFEQLLGSGGQRRQDYLRILAADLSTQARQIVALWQEPGQGYLQRYLADPGARNLQLNQWVMLLEDSKNKRLGAPAGLLDSQGADPALLEAGDSGQSLELLKTALQSFERSFWGAQGKLGMDDYLISLGYRPLADKIRAQFQAVEARLQAVPEPWAQSLKQDPQQARALFDALKELLRYIKVDLANALNETVHFNENDGD
ncbi:MAG: imelysin family protein [Candidatus Sericytochromatia bacterium]